MIARVIALIILFLALGWGAPWWAVVIALFTRNPNA